MSKNLVGDLFILNEELSMTEQEKQQYYAYRFSGYQLPMLQLDSTGAQYIWIPVPHPYYRVEAEWQKTQGLSPQNNVGIAPSLYTLNPTNLRT